MSNHRGATHPPRWLLLVYPRGPSNPPERRPMAPTTIPDALGMRRLKYGGDVSAQERDRTAAALRSQGRRAEAILLYERHPEHPSLRDDLAWAIGEGAAFHVFLL